MDRVVQTRGGECQQSLGLEEARGLFQQRHGLEAFLQGLMQNHYIIRAVWGICRTSSMHYFDAETVPNPLDSILLRLDSDDHEIAPGSRRQKAPPAGSDLEETGAGRSLLLETWVFSVYPAVPESLGLNSLEEGIRGCHGLAELGGGRR
jgi:hypothetical protein